MRGAPFRVEGVVVATIKEQIELIRAEIDKTQKTRRQTPTLAN